MTLEGADRVLSLRLRSRRRKGVVILSEKPCPCVGIQHHVLPTSRVTNLRFERPTVRPPVDQFGRIVLPRRSHHLQAHTQQSLFLPFAKLAHLHRRATLKVDGQSKRRIQKTGAVNLLVHSNSLTL